jgi:3-oxoadipate enol-lactonase
MLHYIEKGQGSAILFIHAFPLNHSMWHPQIDFFADRYRVVALDLYGFGGSQPARPWTIEGMGDEVLTLLDALQIERCTLVGLSIGGYIALPFTAKHPQRVERLVLAHTRARADTEIERENRTQMVGALQQHGIEILPERMLPRLLAPNAPAEIRKRLGWTILKASANAAIFAVTAMRNRPDATALLPQLACPTLVLAGADDAILKADECRQMADAIPGGKFTVIPNAGHLSNIENADTFNRVLDDFLAR